MSKTTKRLCRICLVLLAAIVVADLGLSALLLRDGTFRGRPLPPFGAITHARQEAWLSSKLKHMEAGTEPRSLGVFDPLLGWCNRPSSSSEDGRFQFSALGTRGPRRYTTRASAEKTRIVCFGDSYTYCSEVDDSEAWPALIEEAHANYEALNFGVGGYGTDQALLRFRRDGRKLDADVVCIGLLVENIGRNVNRYRPLYYPSSAAPGVKPRFVLEEQGLKLVPLPYQEEGDLLRAIGDGSVLEAVHEHEYWFADSRPKLLHRSSLGRLFSAWQAYSARQARVLWNDREAEPFQLTLSILRSFHREALESGARRALVLIFPREKDLEGFIAGDHYWRELLRALDEAGIPYLDLAKNLRGPYEEARRDAARPSLYHSGHLSAAGNRIVAEHVQAWVEAQL